MAENLGYTVLSFDAARRGVKARRRVSFSDAVCRLEEIHITTTSARLLQTYAARRLEGIGRVRPLEANGNPREGYTLNPVDNAALAVLNELVPVVADDIESSLLNYDGGELVFVIWPPLKDYTFESVSENVTDSPKSFSNSELSSLLMFTAYLDYGVEATYWVEANEWFGWRLEEFPETSYQASERYNFDRERFFRLLEKQKLGDFKLAFDVQGGQTGNIFLDWDQDDAMQTPISYTLANIEKLVTEWSEAQARIEALQAAAQSARQNGWVYESLAKAWDRACKPARKRKPKTLVEVFNAAHA